MLISPTSDYALAGAYAMGRAMDDAIISAATGTAYGGVAGGTPVVLPAGQKIVHNSTNLTIAKVLAAKKLLDAAEVDPDEARFLICTADQISDFLNITEVKSSDYNTIKALAQGQIDTYLGFKFIRSERLGQDATPNRQVLAFTKSAIGLALGADITTKISERSDKNYATQVFLSMTIGATRIEDEKMVEIACVE